MTADIIIWMIMITLYIMWMIINNGRRCPGRTSVPTMKQISEVEEKSFTSSLIIRSLQLAGVGTGGGGIDVFPLTTTLFPS
jgi:hypothetical protein